MTFLIPLAITIAVFTAALYQPPIHRDGRALQIVFNIGLAIAISLVAWIVWALLPWWLP